MNGLVICPKGCQRGVDENGESGQVREIFSYKPLMSPYGQIVHHLDSENASLPISLTPERQTLNKAIEEKGILSHIQNLLMKAKDARGPRRDLLFDLCAGHPHTSCEQALIQVGISEIAGDGTLPNDGSEKEKKAEKVHKASLEGSLAEVCYYHTFVSVSDSASIGVQTGSPEQMKGHKNGNRIVNRIILWVTAPIHAAFLGKKRPNDQTRLEQSQAHTDSGYTIIMNWHKTQTWLEQSQEHVYSQDILDSVVGALAIRHLLQPSETLADFLLKLSHTRSLGSATHAAFAALVIHRKGEWIQALTTLHKFDGLIAMSVLQVLILIRDNLTEEERHIADEFAREQSEPFLKLDTVDCQRIYHTSIESAIKYLLRIDSSSLEIRQKLLKWNNALPRMRDYSPLQKNEFKRWIKSLLDLTD